MCLTYGNRPSEIMHIEDPYVAYCLDEAMAITIREIKESDKPITLLFSDRDKSAGIKALMNMIPKGGGE